MVNQRTSFQLKPLVRIANRVFVLHVFQKKSKRGSATPKGDAKLIGERLKAAELIARELEL
jgi:phage-related protein